MTLYYRLIPILVSIAFIFILTLAAGESRGQMFIEEVQLTNCLDAELFSQMTGVDPNSDKNGKGAVVSDGMPYRIPWGYAFKMEYIVFTTKGSGTRPDRFFLKVTHRSDHETMPPLQVLDTRRNDRGSLVTKLWPTDEWTWGEIPAANSPPGTIPISFIAYEGQWVSGLFKLYSKQTQNLTVSVLGKFCELN